MVALAHIALWYKQVTACTFFSYCQADQHWQTGVPVPSVLGIARLVLEMI